MSKDSVAKEIWTIIKKIGGTDEVAAGLLGNAEQESGINPKAGANNDDWAYGIFQFEFNTSEYTGFISYCNKKGYKPDTSKAQLNYLFMDGHGDKGYAEHLFNVSPRNGQVGHYNFNGGAQWGYSPHISWKEYLKLKDIKKATEIWELIYEAASLPMMENRISYAKSWYSKLKGSYTGPVDGNLTDEQSSSGTGLLASPEKLYSSNNFEYVKTVEDTTKKITKRNNALKAAIEKRAEERSARFGAFISNLIEDVVAVKLAELNRDITLESKTLVSGSTSTSTLPVVSIFVEAPYFEVEIAGVKFGGYHNNKVPNYVKSLNITKTNGSINEYSIQLIHQISPGDNPNYIDELFSKVGYDIISIRYGNANTGDIFSDNNALITDITENFDFASCNITYTIRATSVASAVSGTRRNFPEFTGKASDEIRRLLWRDKASDLSSIFSGMKNQLEVEKAGLIPSNDTTITMGAVRNITTVGYMAMLVAHMQNSSTKKNELSNSQYTFVIEDSPNGSRFKIKEIPSNITQVPFMYEVNIGYPDDNFVLGFNVNTNFSWSIAYESSKKIKKYDYEIDALGNLETQNIPSYYKNDDDTVGSRTLWTSLTRYPIDATLTVRGLLQDSLLMQYIKVNQYMYGAKRITSGVYIVTEQSDSIGNGVYSTTLKLMRISGDDEYVNLDGRIIT